MSEEKAYEELKYLTEENCRKNCEKNGNCFDCYISFEQVRAIDFIKNKIEQLQQIIREVADCIQSIQPLDDDGHYLMTESDKFYMMRLLEGNKDGKK